MTGHTPVTVVSAGGSPVVQVAASAKNGVPGTVVTTNGRPITLVSTNGAPMILYNENGTEYGGGDSTAPTLSSPVDTKTGTTTGSGSVSTNEGNGTLYWVVSTSATPPSAAQVKAGQMHTGAAAADSGSQAVSGTGVQNISGGFDGLSSATAYTAHYMHEDAATNQSNVVSGDGFTTDSGSFTPADLFATYSGFWLDAAVGTCSDQAGTTPVTADGTTILNWKDQSGNARHFSAASNGPIRKNSIVNSLPVLRWANPSKLDGPNLSSFTAGEIFVVLKQNADPAPSDLTSGLWVMGTAVGGSGSDHYPFTDSTVYMGFGSTTRKSTGNPSVALTGFHLLNIWSAANDWAMQINGTSHFSTGTNTVGFTNAPMIGRSLNVTYFDTGDIAEIICFNAKLSAGERTSMNDYIEAKYGITIA